MGTSSWSGLIRAAANNAISAMGYGKIRTEQGLAFFPKNAWGFDAWQDLAKIHASRNGRIVALDVGANSGQSIVQLKKMFPAAMVYSFEPDPRVFRALEALSRQYSGCQVFQHALGAADGQLYLRCTEESEGSSFLAIDARLPAEMRSGWTREAETVRVPVRTLAAVWQELQLTVVDILKIDVQGYEAAVLEGAGHMLDPATIRSVLFEICMLPLYENQARAPELFDIFERRGYRLVSIYPGGHLATGHMPWCDVLFSAPDS